MRSVHSLTFQMILHFFKRNKHCDGKVSTESKIETTATHLQNVITNALQAALQQMQQTHEKPKQSSLKFNDATCILTRNMNY